MASVTQVGFAKHQTITHVGHIGAVTQQLEKPGTVDGVADHYCTDKLVVFDDEFFVHACTGIGKHNVLSALTTGKITGRKQIDTSDFQLG